MKLVISRKGVDSRSGGIPSPIMPDGTLVPLPIPSRYGPKGYDHVSVNGFHLGPLVGDLAGARMKRHYLCHLDPDLDPKSCDRPRGWRPAFGQLEAAQKHLESHDVGPGDLFLFFGWFRAVEQSGGKWRYIPKSPNLHIIYGWLAVNERILLTDEAACDKRLKPWAEHPHLHMLDRSQNCLYLGAHQLPLATLEQEGAGLFRVVTDTRVLTDQSQSNRSRWKLPGWFHPKNGTSLSYHEDAGRWTPQGENCLLNSVARGQEFVLKNAAPEKVNDWLTSIFEG
ncbi:MAG: hypothetical protein K2X93_09180 [Candidatus Obscuribacterales bacterium]|nr:hypothetical protein [Candidatus Obscuribacterales bacterium]